MVELDRAVKEKLLADVEQAEGRLVSTLQDLVRFPTVNPPGNERAHQEYLAARLQEIGLEVQIAAVDPERPNIVALLPGVGGGNNLLHYAGHADVVEIGDESQWDYPPFGGEVHDGWIYGRGAVDHKAPIAASLIALETLIKNDIRLAGDILFMVPVDEERGSTAGTKYLLEQGLLYGDMGVYASAGFLDEVLIACGGSLVFEITVQGGPPRSGWGALGVNAFEKAAQVVLALQNLTFDKVNPFWQPEFNDALKPTRTGILTITGMIGGQVYNGKAHTCTVRGGRRLIPNETLDEAKGQIEAVLITLSQNDPEFQADIEYLTGVHGINTPPDDPIVLAVEQAVEDIGLEPRIGGSSGGFDARWIVDKLDIPFVSYGAGWNGPDGNLCLHAPNEAISIENLLGMAKAYTMLMIRACGLADT
jgi:succinyl-diaminopimelate desuccinylase